MPKAAGLACLALLFLYCRPGWSQYKGDHIPGFLGLESGTQVPPGIYADNLLWAYPTSTVKDDNGNKINQRGSLTSTLDGILINWVSNYKIVGATYGATVVIPFIQNRIQVNSLDASTGFALTDMIVTPVSLGWHQTQIEFL